MKPEREKPEEEVERLLRSVGLTEESDVAFQEKIRKAASDIEQEAGQIQEEARGARRKKQLISPVTAGLWVLALGAGLSFSIPGLGAVLIIAGIAAIVWGTLGKPAAKHRARRPDVE